MKKSNFNKKNVNNGANNSMNNAAKMAAERAEEHKRKMDVINGTKELARKIKDVKETDAIKEVLSKGLETLKVTGPKSDKKVMEVRHSHDGGSHLVKKLIRGEMKPLDCSGRGKDGLKISLNVLGVDVKIEYTSEVEFNSTSEYHEKASECSIKEMEAEKNAVIEVTNYVINTAIPSAVESFMKIKSIKEGNNSCNNHKESNDGFEPVE